MWRFGTFQCQTKAELATKSKMQKSSRKRHKKNNAESGYSEEVEQSPWVSSKELKKSSPSGERKQSSLSYGTEPNPNV